MSDLLDTVGKLGTLMVAVAVFWTSRRQTKWQNAVAARSAAVEDQKLRLNLLDRRIVALQAVREANREFNLGGEVTAAMMEHLLSALQTAEMVFDEEQEQMASRATREAWLWQHHHRGIRHAEQRQNEKARQRAIDLLFEAQATMMIELDALEKSLKEHTRVAIVPPLSQPEPILRRIRLPMRWRARNSDEDPLNRIA